MAAWKAGGEVHMEGMELVASHSHTKGRPTSFPASHQPSQAVWRRSSSCKKTYKHWMPSREASEPVWVLVFIDSP